MFGAAKVMSWEISLTMCDSCSWLTLLSALRYGVTVSRWRKTSTGAISPQKSKKTKQRNKLFAKRISEALSILLEQ
jgi:hypothetical protein